jgi:replication-associated recombination protein RarA
MAEDDGPRQPGRQRFADLMTPGGYRCDEVASALQKTIRRGHEREALFWATELELAGFGNYVWKRLRIIASEDVGVADPSVALTVRALYENWLDETKRQKDDRYAGFHRVFLLHAVVLLARAPKSRMLDHALMVMYGGERPRPEVPDYALDMHTKRGRQMGRRLDHFFEEGSQLAGETLPDPYLDEGHAALTRSERQRPGRGGEQLEIGD